MADRKHLLHVKSNVVETAEQYGIQDFLVTPKKPNAEDMLFGEIAVNYGKGGETLAIKNSNGEIITFVNENDFNETSEIISETFSYLENKKIDTSDAISKINLITYDEIKTLREQSKLKPGQFYRIIDYVTTTTQTNTQSAGHPFDIIVLATDVNTLNENAKAIKHEGDTYFANSNLDAWEIKYDLDNDTSKYAWADETNGKGVIFYMKDEWNNECPYDFKNIQFERWAVTNVENGKVGGITFNSLDNAFKYEKDSQDIRFGYKNTNCTYGSTTHIIDPTNSAMYYTFSWVNENGDIEDLSIVGNQMISDEGEVEGVFNNVIKSVNKYEAKYNTEESRETLVFVLNNNVFVSSYSYNTGACYGIRGNVLESSCYNNTFGNSCRYNTLGARCIGNTFGDGCYENTFGTNSNQNLFFNADEITLGALCIGNTIGSGCDNIVFGCECDDNTIQNSCRHISLGGKCYSNNFDAGCSNNVLGFQCSNNSILGGLNGAKSVSNIFGNWCTHNTIRVSDHNTFGNNCGSNQLASDCNYNTFGNNCGSNQLAHDCSYNTFGNNCGTNELSSNCIGNRFENNCNGNFFGTGCSNNFFGNGCLENNFETGCSNNFFGNGCSYNNFTPQSGANTFGDNCEYNTFATYCSYNTFGNGVGYVTLEKNYSNYIIVESGNSYITLTSSQETSNGQALRNITIAQGVNNSTSESDLKVITHDTLNDTFKTTYQNVNSKTVDV